MHHDFHAASGRVSPHLAMHQRRRPNWETREDPGGSGGLAELRQAIDDLTATAEQRLAAADTALTEIRSRLDRDETLRGRPGLPADNPDDRRPVETRAFDRFLRRGQEALSAEEVRSIRVSDDTAGGYLAPDSFVPELQRNVVLFSPVRQVARVMPIGTGAAVLPRRTGGMTATWVGETDTRSETTVTFGANRYEVAEIAAYVDVSNAMLEDSAFDVAALLTFEFGEEFGKKEGSAFVSGNGVVKPTGFMSDANLSYTASGSASAVTADGLIDLYHALPSPYRGTAVWMMNSATIAAVRKLKDGAGNYLILTAGLAGQVTTTLLGRPVIEAPDMPAIAGDAYPIAFGDFMAGYRIFDRIPLAILRDPYSQAAAGMVRFHGRRRVAGGVGKAEAIRKLKIATS
jgi:HK97 family phage major capsid protein